MTQYWKQLPNALTVLRFIAAPATALLLLYDHFGAALVIFALAGVSDLLDGFLAKRYGITSRFGRYLDPAADKALMFACYLVLTIQQIVPLWLTAIVIGRDAIMVVCIVIARLTDAPITITPLRVGKLTTVAQVTFIGVQLLALALGLDFDDVPRWLGFATATVTVASAYVYGMIWLRAMTRPRPKGRAHARKA